MEDIIKLLEQIKEHQMNTVHLARSTEVYRLADKALAKALPIHDDIGSFWSDNAITRLKAEYFEKGLGEANVTQKMQYHNRKI